VIATNEAIVIACPERLQRAIGALLSEILSKFLRYRSREGQAYLMVPAMDVRKVSYRARRDIVDNESPDTSRTK